MHTIITADKTVVKECASWREASWSLDRIVSHKMPQVEVPVAVGGDALLGVIEGNDPATGKVVELYTKLV